METTSNIKISPVNVKERRDVDIRTGDTVRVYTKVVEKGKTRTQPFEGIVIARKHGAEPGGTFTVRRVSGGYGVERIFPLYSPNIEKIDILRRSKVRQANVYHIRRKVAKQIRREMRRMRLLGTTLTDESVDEDADLESGEQTTSDNVTDDKKENDAVVESENDTDTVQGDLKDQETEKA